ncbi:MAG: ATP-dependent RNA helicase HrpA [Actinomycetota bacterium]
MARSSRRPRRSAGNRGDGARTTDPARLSDLAQLRETLTYPAELPITERRAELVEAIAAHQVLIVAGETGSGKSTQLPKLCIEAGRGRSGLIGHTQPRRLAARSIAERIAEETGTEVGGPIGFAFRFTDRIGGRTSVKLMTDGILLAEIQRDRDLNAYDTIIIDEAHERSLNIDFILGYLRQLLPRRPDLHVIVTSATIDTERFSAHFDGAPIIEVSGRTYPVEIRYRPLDGPDVDEPLTQPEAISAAVRELTREGPGDLLVFLPGERDIRETAEALEDLGLADTEVFPLFARLSAAEQHRVFSSHRGRRIVLATNVAETSVTVPGIRYVIDPGTARISRYNRRTKVQRLPIEAVSQASADQRAGRCGRIGPGVCIRLYAEDDYDAREEFTEPEIKRTNLASVILQMASLGLGDISSFPFVEPPDGRSITDGIQLLEELDALDPDRHGTREWLTPMGRELVRFPVDPRFGRMLIEAADNGVLEPVTVIVAGLSIIDPRERPSENEQAADEAHRRFADGSSDFVTLLNLWDHVRAERSARSNSGFRRLCRREFLNYNRIREWQDIHSQLTTTAKDLGYRRSGRDRPAEGADGEAAFLDAVHRSLLAGLLSQIGMKDLKAEREAKRRARTDDRGRRRPRPEYLGPRQAKFAIAPRSALTRQGPTWVMAAELVETNRLWARMAAPIDPRWAEDLGHYLVTRSYTEPTWDRASGVAQTTERVTLYGLPLVDGRRMTVGRVNPELARELFIHHALVEDDWDADHGFLARNREVLAEVERLEAKTRRRDLLADQERRTRFFDERLPSDIASGRHFNRWWKAARAETPDLLTMTVADLLSDRGAELDLDRDDFPDSWIIGDIDLELAYEFDTGSHVDGVSVHVPVEVLNQLDPQPFQWSVPGLRAELVGALLRTLPKQTRKALVPIADTVEAILPELDPAAGGLLETLRDRIGRRTGVTIPPDGFDPARVPAHLRPTFRVINDRFEVLAEGKDLAALQELMAEQVRQTLTEVLADAAAEADLERTGLRTWDPDLLPDELPAVVTTAGPAHTVRAYPALVDDGDSVAVRLFPDPDEQAEAMWTGTRRLIRLQLPSPVRTLDRLVDDRTKLQLAAPPVQSRAQWYNDAIDCAVDESIAVSGGPSRSRDGFDRLVEAARSAVPEHLETLAGAIAQLVRDLSAIDLLVEPLAGSSVDVSIQDIRAHLARLAYPGMLAGVGLDRVPDVVRYVAAIRHRAEHVTEQPGRDVQAAAECVRLEQRHAELVGTIGLTPELEAVTWLLEEFRVVQFAQQLKRPEKVSAARIDRRLGAIASAAGR